MDGYSFEEDQRNKEGVSVETSPLTLNIDDALLLEIIEQRMKSSNKYYDDELKISDRTKLNEKFWLGDQLPTDLAPHLEPYKDNIIWQDSEKRIELASGRMPDIILTPAADNEVKRERAKMLEKQLQIIFSSGKMKRIIKDGLRQHGIYLLSAIKCRWDPNKGENGDFVFELVRPNRFGLDHTGTISHDGFSIDNIELFWEIIEEPLAVTLAKFPDKATELKGMLKNGNTPQGLVSKIRYHEVHFTWYTNNGQPIECVAHKYKSLILDKIKTPYFDYEGYTKRVWEDELDPNVPDGEVNSRMGKFYRNHFEKPRKNYILFSHQNLGRSPYDDTTAIEQTIALQRNINKRGRQITDIADKMKPRFAFNASMKKKDAEAISNDSDEHIWLDNKEPINNVITSFQSLPPSIVLFNDMAANRGQIDSKFSTHGNVRGEVTGSNESGISKQITREGDLTTSDDIVDIVVERVIYEMASWAVQMMKLLYEKPHFVRDIGPDGEMVQSELTRDSIDDGIAINVKASSQDKAARRNDAFNLAKVKGIDPLTLAEDMDVPNPKERTRRLMYFLMGEQDQYTRYMKETGLLDETEGAPGQEPLPAEQAPQGAETPPPGQQGPVPPEQTSMQPPPAGPQQFGQVAMDAQQAQLDLQALTAGEQIQPAGIPTPEYVQVFAQFIQDPQFDTLDPTVQNNIKSYISALQQLASQQAPPPVAEPVQPQLAGAI